MVDPLRVQRLLRSVTDELAFLDAEADAGANRRSDAIWLRGIKYSFIAAIEACVDIAHHLCATAGWGPPADNGDAMRLLGEHGVLGRDLATELRKAVGFRNVLVHDYADVDENIVLARLGNPGALRDFASGVAEYLQRADADDAGGGRHEDPAGR